MLPFKFRIMKITKILTLFFIALIVSSCAVKKGVSTTSLTGAMWELEYLSGPRIAFEGLYPDKKPQITFNEETKKAEGTNSCNGYSADFRIMDGNISFGEPGMTTMMYCGEGEGFFLSTIKKVNKYKIDENGKLNLMIGDVPMMRFKKIN